jgi:DNA-binding LacI/PurR family transcriptional regulator
VWTADSGQGGCDDLVAEGEFEIAGGQTNTIDLLRLADPPTAIFALNDGMAIGVYHAASQAGLRIPEDLSVIGFDDYPLDPWLVPPLTTVRQPLTDMVAAAARMVVGPGLRRRAFVKASGTGYGTGGAKRTAVPAR